MSFLDLFKLSTRMFKARTMRTFLTVLGMSIGIGAILFLVSLGYGLQKALLERITTSDSLLTLDVTEPKSALVRLDREMAESIRQDEGIEEISPAFQLTAQGQMDDLSADLGIMGVRPSFLRFGGIKVSRGEGLSDENKENIIISSTVSQLFGKSQEEMIGGEIRFNFLIPEEKTEQKENAQSNFRKVSSEKTYKIVGVIEGEDNLIYIHSDSLENLAMEKFSQLKVKCQSNEKMNLVRDKIIARGLVVSSLSDTVDQANQIFGIVQIVLMFFGIIALVVSAIGMFNTMTIALLERTEEIGIMKSIGASDMMVSLMFVMESTIMGFLGGLGGVILGLLGGEAFNALINLLATRFGGSSVDLFYSPAWFIGLIIAFAAFVGFLTGFIPARRASKIDPLDALRYK
ncbi:MAG: ABC transporter permease [Patescibacteria group bacterium]